MTSTATTSSVLDTARSESTKTRRSRRSVHGSTASRGSTILITGILIVVAALAYSAVRRRAAH